MATDPSITPNAGPPEGFTGRQGHADGSNEGLALPGAASPSEARTELSAFGQGVLARFVIPVLADPGMVPPPTGLSGAESAQERSEVAGEPDDGLRRPPGREAPLDRTRRYLVPVASLKLPGHPNDRHLAVYEWVERCEAWATGPALCGYSTRQGALPDDTPVTCAECLERRPGYEHALSCDGCNRECLKAGKHSLRWGLCEHAVEPEPTVSMSVVYTDPEDGYPAIGFDRYTTAELAELIKPALRKVGIRLGPIAVAMHQGGGEVPLPAEECARLALAAADAIVTHSNRDGS